MNRTQIVLAATFSLCSVVSAVDAVAQQAGVDPRPPNAPKQTPAFAGQTRAPERKLNVAFDVVTVAEGLDNPVGLAFLPGGKMLVTETRRAACASSTPTASCRQPVARPAGGRRPRPGRTARRRARSRRSRRTS